MAHSEKIAITLPQEIYKRVERLRRGTQESRSAVVQRALRLLFRASEHESRVRDYVDAYTRDPESEDEIRVAEKSAVELAKRIPWE